MKFSRRDFVAGIFALASTLTVTLPVQAQTAGTDYMLIPSAQQTEDPRRIEVLEFFSYGCSHCNVFYPQLTSWIAKLPADVVVRKVPVSFNGYFQVLAPIYYALEVMGEAERLDKAVFKSIHSDGLRLIDAKERAAWATKNGLDARKFEDVYNSFGVASKVRRAAQMTQAYAVQGVPALAIEGKYLISGREPAESLAIADKLIAKVRAEKSGKK